MENLHQHFSWKAWLIVLFAISVIIISLMIFPLLFRSSDQNSSDSYIRPTKYASPDSEVPGFEAPTKIPITSTKVFKNEIFSFEYPREWSVEEKTIAGGGRSWTLTPQKTIPSSPLLEIQIYNSTSTSLETLRAIFKGFKYQEQIVTIDDNPAYFYRGKIVSSADAFQDTVVFSKGTSTYKFQFTYQAASLEQDLERIFSFIVFSLKLFR